MEEIPSPISHSLFSSLLTFYIIILLYCPKYFTQIALSPVLMSTFVLLISLLRLGSNQKLENKINSNETEQTHKNLANRDHNFAPRETKLVPKIETGQNPLFFSFVKSNARAQMEVLYEEESDTKKKINFNETKQISQQNSANEDHNSALIETNSDRKIETGQNPLFFSFIESNVRAPLEVIYEEEDDFGYPFSFLHCSGSDSDESSSEEDFPETRLCFEWEREEERGGLIEIELNKKVWSELFNGEEDNLIEIDIFSPEMISF